MTPQIHGLQRDALLSDEVYVIAMTLPIIFEKFCKAGEVPESERKASVTSAFKQGKEEDLGNYKPVSLNYIPWKGKLI